MMNKTSVINTRIEPSLKNKAEHILHKTGLSSAEAIRLFYTQVCLNNGLPFEIKIPNKRTQKAMIEAEQRKTKKTASVATLFNEIV
jgi:DNA-damage-inducible protein J